MSLALGAKSSVGKKAVMAITGLLLFGFILGHLIGNLLVFAGPDALNAYGHKLQSLGPMLWVMRIGLLLIVGLHIASAVMITAENKAARPITYVKNANIQSTYAARTMMISGLILLGYIVYHLLHFTFKVTHPEFAHLTTDKGYHDVYTMVVSSFKDPIITGVYILSMFLLCSHLSHGLSSLFQSLGLTNEQRLPCLKKVAIVVSVLIFIGYSSIPVSIFLGFVKTAGGSA